MLKLNKTYMQFSFYHCFCLSHFFVSRIKLQPKIEMRLLAPGTIVLKERFFFSMVANLPHTELYKLNLHVKKSVRTVL